MAVVGCGAPTLEPAERYAWSEQPIAFSAPPPGWRREGDLSGGRRGVRFVKERSVGEASSVAEYYLVGDRDRRATLQELLAKLDTYDDYHLKRALVLAKCRTDEPLNALESQVAERVNGALDRATLACLQDDRAEVQRAVGDALVAAETMRLSLGDVIDRVVFRPDRCQEPRRYKVIARQQTTIAGVPAVTVDYTVQTDERLFPCREVYLVHDNHLYIASFIGLKHNLALFDRVVASITWPPRMKGTTS
jgi:hypothetical protein